MSFGTRIRVAAIADVDRLRYGIILLACANGRYIVAVERGNGHRFARVLRADQLEVL